MKRALLASYTKDGSLERLAQLLLKNNWSLWGSAGTAKHLSARSLPCRDIGDHVGPPILGHRVVTLARKVYASLLAVSKNDMEELHNLGIHPIGLVYVTLYPLEEVIADPRSKPQDILEKTDIGGPTLLRAAAKGRRFALSDPSHIDWLAEWFAKGSPEKEREQLIIRLAAAAERRVADYVDASARYWEKQAQ